MSVQKGVGFSIVVEKVAMYAQATIEDMKQKLMKTNTEYKEATDRHHHAKVFLHEERFLVGSYSKLRVKKYCPYTIIKKFANNAYVIDILDNMSIFKTFNVLDIYPFYNN